MVNKNVKTLSMSLTLWEIQIKTTKRCYHISLRLLSKEKKKKKRKCQGLVRVLRN